MAIPNFWPAKGGSEGSCQKSKLHCVAEPVLQRLPRELANKVVSHIKIIRDLRRSHSYQAHEIAAMDKTGLWLDMLGRTTLEEKGKRTVCLKTTGHEKDHFTVVLATRADGSKIHPMVILKGK